MKKKLGEILIASGVVTAADIEEVLNDQCAGEPARLGDQLIALGRLTSFQLAKALATQHGLPYMGLPAIPPRVMAAIPLDYQQTHRLVPFRVDGDTVSIAVADPSNTDAVEELRYSLNRRIVVAIAPGDEIDAVHSAYASAPKPAATAPKYIARPSPAPTADELFGGLEALESPPQPSSPSALEDLFGELSAEKVAEAEVPEFQSEEVNFDDEPSEAPGAPAVSEPEPPDEVIEMSDSYDDEVSFESSPSSLESLVIEPEVPVLPDRVNVSPPRAAPGKAKPAVPAPAPSGPSLPDWLRNPASSPSGTLAQAVPLPAPARADEPAEASEPVTFEWSGKLDDVPPSRLIVAAVKALVLKGAVTEQAILDLLAKK